MAGKRVSKDERDFICLLASKLKKEDFTFVDDDLGALFENALSNLPDCNLKSVLAKNQKTHLKKLISLVKENVSKQKEIPFVKELTEKYNFYNEKDIEKVIGEAKASKSSGEKCDIVRKLWSCYPYLKDSERMFSYLEGMENYAAVEQIVVNTVGCFDQKNVLDCLCQLLRIFSTECDACMASREKSKCLNLIIAVQKTIMVMNNRWKSNDINTATNNVSLKDKTFEDIIAAMMSIYSDLTLLSDKDNDDSSSIDKLPSLLFNVLGHSPEQCMDVMLQLTEPNERLLPLIKNILERNAGQQSHRQYIKFICLARLALKLSTSPDTNTSLLKVAEAQSAPTGFVMFLNQLNESMARRLRISNKLSSFQITTNLLDDLREEDMEELLDIVTQNPGKDNQDDKEEVIQQDDIPTSENQLFFIDSSGAADETEENEVQIEDNRKKDAMLRRQIKSVEQEAKQDSDFEENEIFFEM